MESSNEIRIRISSPIRFIDDDSAEESGRESLTVAHGKDGHSSAKKERPERSPSPKPKENMTLDLTSGKKQKRQPLELTIRGENTIISIQTIAPDINETKRDSDNDEKELYDMIEQKVREIFQSPGKEEIEKALEACSEVDSSGKGRKFKKKGIWQTLLTSAKASARDQKRDLEERYPSIVLLQDAPEVPPEDQYRKMIMGDDSPRIGNLSERPKFEFRSRSMLTLPTDWKRTRAVAMNEIALEKHSIALERTYLEKEIKCLVEEREGLEKGKTRLVKEKRALEKGKSFLVQERKILNDKKNILNEERASLQENPENEQSVLKKEKLCLDMEKQLLDDERKIIGEEQDILQREKEIMDKERSLLGGEKNVLEEEKVILGKEKSVMEKQKHFAEDRDDERSGDSMVSCSEDVRNVESDIDEIFEDTLHLSREGLKGGHHHPASSRGESAIACGNFGANSCCWGNPYPVYIPVYSLPRPYATSSCRSCSKPVPAVTKKAHNIQTQTENQSQIPSGPEVGPSLPLGLLSGILPRVLITNMNPFGEDREKSKIIELPEDDHFMRMPPSLPAEPSPAASHAPVKIAHAKKSQKVPLISKSFTTKKTKLRSTYNTKTSTKTTNLQPAQPDLTLKAVSPHKERQTTEKQEDLKDYENDLALEPFGAKFKKCDSLEESESGVFTFPSEFQLKDEFCISDETISVENIHFGLPDDFYSNESLVPKCWKIDDKDDENDDQPLTKAGKSLFEKLTELKIEPGPSSSRQEDSKEDNSCNCNLELSLSTSGTSLQITIPNSYSINLGDAETAETARVSTSRQEKIEGEEETSRVPKVSVKKSRLWYSDDEDATKKPKRSPKGIRKGPKLEFSFQNNEKNTIQFSENCGISIKFGSQDPPLLHRCPYFEDRCSWREPLPEECQKTFTEDRLAEDDPEKVKPCMDLVNPSQKFISCHHRENCCSQCCCSKRQGLSEPYWREEKPLKHSGFRNPVCGNRQTEGKSDLSPRTARLLQALKERLEHSQSERNFVNFGKAPEDQEKAWAPHSSSGLRENTGKSCQAQTGSWTRNLPNGLYLVKQSSPPPCKRQAIESCDYPSTREYYCEECLATMRLYEDQNESVQSIINKFENISGKKS